MEPSNKQLKMVYTVVERDGKSFWTKIGIGTINKDGSMNLKLEALPVNGTIQVRDWEPREDRDRRPDANGARANGHRSADPSQVEA